MNTGLITAFALLLAIPVSALAAEKTDSGHEFTAEPKDRTLVTQAQIFLDQSLFGPGFIDGRVGEFTRKAVAHYNTKEGITPIHNWGPLLERAATAVPEPLTSYTITAGDKKYVDSSLPYDFPKQAERKTLPYRRITEFLSERFHTDEDYIKELNPGSSYGVGSTVKVPNVTPFKIESVSKDKSYGKADGLSARHVVVDTGEKMATIWDTATQSLIASFPITPGKEKFIHRGEWTLKNMITTPEFRYDKSMLQEGKRSDDFLMIPGGPNSPVGIIWCGTSKSGIGLHGTSSPHTIGRSRSAGCIRFANWDAIRLPTLFRPGAKVTIR